MTSTRLRASARAWAVVTLVCALVTSSAVGASAEAASSPDWAFDLYDVQSVQDQGWTGEGVKVAVIGSQINPDLPVFAGQNLTLAEGALCADGGPVASTEATASITHDTTVVAYINGNGTGNGSIRGIAPGADVTFYGNGPASDAGCYSAGPEDVTTFGWGVQRAVDDGARIVITSRSSADWDGDAEAVANAVAKGVVVVVATPNPSSTSDSGYPHGYNGVVAASGVDREGMLQTRDDGQPQAIADTTVVAAGDSLAVIGSSTGGWDAPTTGTGSSFAAPIVAGMLAVVAQRYPDASGNQLIQTLIHNTGREDHALARDESGGYGYGAAWLTHMLQVDPAQYPDENPLMTKSTGVPSVAQVDAAAARGFTLPEAVETAAPPPAPAEGANDSPDISAASASPMSTLVPVVLTIAAIVVGLIVIGVIILVIFMTNARKKRKLQGGPA
ncbi:S8 family serine peptidase [Microbacterium sp. P04]|uniref:S8 family serine peptidase n=1 Tax=Microbacterium sp. P04 TaxID=3366947 RepID=UPI003746DAAB